MIYVHLFLSVWLTDGCQARPGDVEGGLEPDPRQLGEGVHQEGQVAAHIVHQEQECPDTDGPDAHRHNLNQDSEQQGKPGLSCKTSSFW